jgi:hypothetical protein
MNDLSLKSFPSTEEKDAAVSEPKAETKSKITSNRFGFLMVEAVYGRIMLLGSYGFSPFPSKQPP